MLDHARLISLAAGVAPGFAPDAVIRAAAQAGFNAAGIWYEAGSWSADTSRRVAHALAETGLCPLDLEVAWFKPGEALDEHDAMVDVGVELGVRNILCVSSEPDITHSKRRFEHLCRRAEGSGMRIVLEFLVITEINSLHKALEVVRDVAHPAGGILVDTLHLYRTGAKSADLDDVDPRLLPYLQLCDATASIADTSPEGLLEDALYLRRLPGAGELPLRDVLDRLDPNLPLSLEIRSRDLMQRFGDDLVARASCVLASTRRFLQAAAA